MSVQASSESAVGPRSKLGAPERWKVFLTFVALDKGLACTASDLEDLGVGGMEAVEKAARPERTVACASAAACQKVRKKRKELPDRWKACTGPEVPC